jgi:phosphohistidine phosphatase
MKRLTLVRHADSPWDGFASADMDRPLNAGGERDALDMASRLLAARLAPSLMISSPARRALATARVFAGTLGYPATRIRLAAEAYLASPVGLLELLRRKGGRARHVMLFGHNPGISAFAALLAGEAPATEMPTGAITSLSVPLRHWGELRFGEAVRDFYDFPKNKR